MSQQDSGFGKAMIVKGEFVFQDDHVIGGRTIKRFDPERFCPEFGKSLQEGMCQNMAGTGGKENAVR
ncbi:hypothetical protein [Rhabdaerophilum sp.]|uniref:hypothetical protein n=1 Tax=Rhabdaerophilum sp. TaxID=2717341 RepID=UPI0038D4FF23